MAVIVEIVFKFSIISLQLIIIKRLNSFKRNGFNLNLSYKKRHYQEVKMNDLMYENVEKTFCWKKHFVEKNVFISCFDNLVRFFNEVTDTKVTLKCIKIDVNIIFHMSEKLWISPKKIVVYDYFEN